MYGGQFFCLWLPVRFCYATISVYFLSDHTFALKAPKTKGILSLNSCILVLWFCLSCHAGWGWVCKFTMLSHCREADLKLLSHLLSPAVTNWKKAAPSSPLQLFIIHSVSTLLLTAESGDSTILNNNNSSCTLVQKYQRHIFLCESDPETEVSVLEEAAIHSCSPLFVNERQSIDVCLWSFELLKAEKRQPLITSSLGMKTTTRVCFLSDSTAAMKTSPTVDQIMISLWRWSKSHRAHHRKKTNKKTSTLVFL